MRLSTPAVPAGEAQGHTGSCHPEGDPVLWLPSSCLCRPELARASEGGKPVAWHVSCFPRLHTRGNAPASQAPLLSAERRSCPSKPPADLGRQGLQGLEGPLWHPASPGPQLENSCLPGTVTPLKQAARPAHSSPILPPQPRSCSHAGGRPSPCTSRCPGMVFPGPSVEGTRTGCRSQPEPPAGSLWMELLKGTPKPWPWEVKCSRQAGFRVWGGDGACSRWEKGIWGVLRQREAKTSWALGKGQHGLQACPTHAESMGEGRKQANAVGGGSRGEST